MQARRKRNPLGWLLLAIALVAAWQLWPARDAAQNEPALAPAPREASAPQSMPASPALAEVRADPAPALPDFLPAEAHRTIALIQRGGPFPHRQDGGVFGNREGHLPRQPSGWYREYTVDTPGLGHRGARRIVTGGQPPREWYYTDDHYDSFRRFDPAGGPP
ncbi:ribonuclease domain-containing protein [Thermomonas carbonis]|uniref:Ribonuclease n=1 Tax=Thermomonas carbonis TaxID=1463158 RepID=A0A7G9SQ19_9GAMM|nr:ribonuclease domain-containing protein [Thermomonas carbonis]QNN69944.1 ribonuclease [Thermomonas carbonis]GHB96524.1 ribonuclease [Thermomonas carbonis]